MAEAIEEFFASLPVRARRNLPGPIRGTLRIDLVRDGQTEHWHLTLAPKKVEVRRSDEPADTVLTISPELFERIVQGRSQLFAAAYRSDAIFTGNGTLILAFRRLLPDPPGTRDPREVARERLSESRTRTP